jgi:anti-sigma factor RsiW
VARPPCPRIVALLSDYLDGRLPSDIRVELDQHLAGCAKCAAFMETFRSTVSLLHSLEDADLPEELRLRLRAFLDDHSAC